MLTLEVKITKEDIEKGKWHCHYCPEALALKRTLKENNISFFGAKIKPDNRYKHIVAEIFYPIITHPPSTCYENAYYNDIISTTYYIQKVNKLAKWSKEMDKCYKSGDSGSTGYIFTTNNNYDKNAKKSDIHPTTFEISVSEELKNAPNFDILKKLYSEEDLCYHNNGIYLENEKIKINLLEKSKDNRIYLDWLSCGELARRDFSDFSVVKVLNYKNNVFENTFPKKEILVPTFPWTEDGLYKTIDNALNEYENREDLQIFIAIRQIAFNEIEAGIVIVFNEK